MIPLAFPRRDTVGASSILSLCCQSYLYFPASVCGRKNKREGEEVGQESGLVRPEPTPPRRPGALKSIWHSPNSVLTVRVCFHSSSFVQCIFSSLCHFPLPSPRQQLGGASEPNWAAGREQRLHQRLSFVTCQLEVWASEHGDLRAVEMAD